MARIWRRYGLRVWELPTSTTAEFSNPIVSETRYLSQGPICQHPEFWRQRYLVRTWIWLSWTNLPPAHGARRSRSSTFRELHSSAVVLSGPGRPRRFGCTGEAITGGTNIGHPMRCTFANTLWYRERRRGRITPPLVHLERHCRYGDTSAIGALPVERDPSSHIRTGDHRQPTCQLCEYVVWRCCLLRKVSVRCYPSVQTKRGPLYKVYCRRLWRLAVVETEGLSIPGIKGINVKVGTVAIMCSIGIWNQRGFQLNYQRYKKWKLWWFHSLLSLLGIIPEKCLVQIVFIPDIQSSSTNLSMRSSQRYIFYLLASIDIEVFLLYLGKHSFCHKVLPVYVYGRYLDFLNTSSIVSSPDQRYSNNYTSNSNPYKYGSQIPNA